MRGNRTVKYILILILSITSFICCYYFEQNIKVGFIFSAGFLAVGLIPFEKIKIHREYWGAYFAFVYIGSAFIDAFLSQFLLNEKLLTLGWTKVILEVIICLWLFLLFFFICLNYKLSIILISLIIVMLSTINYYVYEFKGNELQPGDIFAIRTAKNVISEYQIVIAPTVLYAAILCGIFVFFIIQLPKCEVYKKLNTRILSLASVIVLSLIFVLLSRPIHAQYFLNTGESQNGYLLNFVLQMRSTHVDAPDNYSLEKIEEISEGYVSLDSKKEENNYPDIIVIMDESYANLSKLGNKIDVNAEITPFINSLSENITRGYALSSIFGGGTPNSEYEFLTGNSLIFLPEGTYVYSQYLKSAIPSMVSEMNTMGYKTVGMHPYYSTGWNRDVVYPLLGFDEIYFLDAFEGYDTVRHYISDRGMFEMITDYYEKMTEAGEEPLFLFGVTMQNHGGYEYSGEDFNPTIQLNGNFGDNSEAEQYLSLLNETDLAVQYLINYYKEVNRDVVIVFFGDHYPRLDESIYLELHGGPFDSLMEKQLRYEIPFFIWTNYESEEKDIELTSLNYLSNYVYEAANIPLPEYNRFLKKVQENIPAVNSQGFYSLKEQKYLTLDQASGTDYELLNQYHMLVYNSLFDLQNLGGIFR